MRTGVRRSDALLSAWSLLTKRTRCVQKSFWAMCASKRARTASPVADVHAGPTRGRLVGAHQYVDAGPVELRATSHRRVLCAGAHHGDAVPVGLLDDAEALGLAVREEHAHREGTAPCGRRVAHVVRSGDGEATSAAGVPGAMIPSPARKPRSISASRRLRWCTFTSDVPPADNASHSIICAARTA